MPALLTVLEDIQSTSLILKRHPLRGRPVSHPLSSSTGAARSGRRARSMLEAAGWLYGHSNNRFVEWPHTRASRQLRWEAARQAGWRRCELAAGFSYLALAEGNIYGATG